METTSTREVYSNPWMTVREDGIVRQDGSAGLYGVVDKPDYALIVPLDEGRLHLVEQYRYPLGRRRWEFPQGTAPDRQDVDTSELAERELREETGLLADEVTLLGSLDAAPGMSSQRGRAYLATGLAHGPHERELEEQDMRAAWFSRGEFEAMVREGQVTDAQSIAAYTLLLLRERAM